MVPRRIGLLLIDGFALMSFASAMEPLRAANVIAGRELYAWRHIAVGEVALASSGLRLAPDHRVGDAVELDMLLVVAGGNPAEFRDPGTLRWLRRLARGGTPIGGVSGGPFVLARAGLLDGYRCTIHWEHVPAFHETFPRLQMTRRLYEIDRDRLTCAGGVAALDMMHALIAQDHGRALADAVAEWFLQTEIRAAGGAQRRSLQERFRVTSRPLLAALDALDSSVEEPPSRAALARIAGVSVRQLERLFAAELGTTIARHRQGVQLDRARQLLRQSAMPIVEVAVASGFASASHFSRAYKAAFGLSPRQDRARL
jgi:transcriptional regulator GlxA family with amidase domain